MKKHASALLVLTLGLAAWLAPSPASAVPKMDVKVAVGVGSTTLVPRLPNIEIPNTMPPPDTVVVGGRNASTFPNWACFSPRACELARSSARCRSASADSTST